MIKRPEGLPAPPSALDELLIAERELAAEAERVAAECAAVVDAARVEAAAIERDAAARLERDAAADREAGRRALEAELRSLDEAAARAIAHFEGLSDDDVLRFADVVATRVMGIGNATTAGRAP